MRTSHAVIAVLLATLAGALGHWTGVRERRVSATETTAESYFGKLSVRLDAIETKLDALAIAAAAPSNEVKSATETSAASSTSTQSAAVETSQSSTQTVTVHDDAKPAEIESAAQERILAALETAFRRQKRGAVGKSPAQSSVLASVVLDGQEHQKIQLDNKRPFAAGSSILCELVINGSVESAKASQIRLQIGSQIESLTDGRARFARREFSLSQDSDGSDWEIRNPSGVSGIGLRIVGQRVAAAAPDAEDPLAQLLEVAAYREVALSRFAQVNGDSVRLRQAASADAKIVELVYRGNWVMLLGGDKQWAHVRLAHGVEGWISADLLQHLEVAGG